MHKLQKIVAFLICFITYATPLSTKTAIQLDGIVVGIVEGTLCHLLETQVLTNRSWCIKYPVSWLGIKFPVHLLTTAYLSSTHEIISQIATQRDQDFFEKIIIHRNNSNDDTAKDAAYAFHQSIATTQEEGYIDDFHFSRRVASWLTYLSLKIYDAYQQKKESQEKLAAEPAENISLKN